MLLRSLAVTTPLHYTSQQQPFTTLTFHKSLFGGTQARSLRKCFTWLKALLLQAEEAFLLKGLMAARAGSRAPVLSCQNKDRKAWTTVTSTQTLLPPHPLCWNIDTEVCRALHQWQTHKGTSTAKFPESLSLSPKDIVEIEHVQKYSKTWRLLGVVSTF